MIRVTVSQPDLTFHPLHSYFSKLPATDRSFLLCWHLLFVFLHHQLRNTQGHPANMVQLGINSSSTMCQKDEISLSGRRDTVLGIAVLLSFGGGWGVKKAGKQLVKDRGGRAKAKTRALTCQKAKVTCSSPWETTAVSPNTWAGRAASNIWTHTKLTDVLGHYNSWPWWPTC